MKIRKSENNQKQNPRITKTYKQNVKERIVASGFRLATMQSSELFLSPSRKTRNTTLLKIC